MPNSNSTKLYNPALGCAKEFFIPNPQANHFNAQDVACELIGSAKDIASALFQCFDGGHTLVIRGDIAANLIDEIKTKLEMAEKILPMAFEDAPVQGTHDNEGA